MKPAFASVPMALVLMTVAACGGDVPAGLVDKIRSGCPDLIKPEPVAVITEGFEVAQVTQERGDTCTISVQDGRQVLFVGLIGYPSQEMAEQHTAMACPGGKWDRSDKSCVVAPVDGKRLTVRGVAGRWEVKISVSEVPLNDEVRDAAYQILKDLRSSDKTR